MQIVFVTTAAVCALLLSGTSIRLYWNFGKVVLPFVLLVSFLYPFLYTGKLTGDEAIAVHTPIKDLPWVALSFGVMLALRFLTFALVGLMYAFTTHPDDIIQAAFTAAFDYLDRLDEIVTQVVQDLPPDASPEEITREALERSGMESPPVPLITVSSIMAHLQLMIGDSQIAIGSWRHRIVTMR